MKYAKVYGQIVLARTGAPQIDRRLRNLRMIKSLQTYGFLMHLQVGGCDSADFETILRLTEALMVRRHTCRERSNENETLFARLCSVDATNPVPNVIAEFRPYSPPRPISGSVFQGNTTQTLSTERGTAWSSSSISARETFSELIVGGTDSVHVEHIIPQKIKTQKAKKEFGDWTEYLGNKSGAWILTMSHELAISLYLQEHSTLASRTTRTSERRLLTRIQPLS